MRVLHLILKRQWFEMIQSGYKKEEYREIKEYWIKRLRGQSFDVICFRNGYRADSPEIWIECKGITEGAPRPEWSGSDMNNPVFVISLGDFITK